MNTSVLTQLPVHLCQGGVVEVQFAVLQEPPELHATHHKRVVWALLVANAAVEVVDLAQAGHVAHKHKQYLEGSQCTVF